MIYKAMRSLSNTRKFLIFDVLYRREKLTTWDLHHSEGIEQKLGYVNDAVREFEQLKLADYVGKQRPVDQKARECTPSEETQYKCYQITPLGKMVHTLCASASSDNPYSDFLAKADPEDIVSEYANVDKAKLRELLSSLADMRHLGALLMVLYYSKGETSDVDKLGERTDLDSLYVSDVLNKHVGELVEAGRKSPSLHERIGLLIARMLRRSKLVNEYEKTAGLMYSLTTRGRTVARGLAENLDPEDLGVSREQLEIYPEGVIKNFVRGFLSVAMAYVGYLIFTEFVGRLTTVLQSGFIEVSLSDLLGSLLFSIVLGGVAVYLAYGFVFRLRLYLRERERE